MLPVFSINETNFFKGYFYETKNGKVVIYITKYSKNESLIDEGIYENKNRIYGRCGQFTEPRSNSHKNYLELHPDSNKLLKMLTLNGAKIRTHDCVILLYDYDQVKESQIISSSLDSEDYFATLQSLILKDCNDLAEKNKNCAPSLAYNGWLASSMFVQHTLNYINLLNWLKNSIKSDKKVIKMYLWHLLIFDYLLLLTMLKALHALCFRFG